MKDDVKYFGLFVDGRGYVGECSGYTPPELTLQTKSKRGGGMDVGVAVDMGMEDLSVSFKLHSYSRDVLALWGLVRNGRVPVTVRGALEDGDGVVTQVRHLTRGLITQVREGEWTPGGGTELTFTQRCDFYERRHGDEVIHRIDAENMVRIVDGVDQLAEHRKAIGR